MACIALGLFLLAHLLPMVVVAGTALAGNGLVAICTGNGIEFVRVEDGATGSDAGTPLRRDQGQQADGFHCAGCLAAGSKLLPHVPSIPAPRLIARNRCALPASDNGASDASRVLPPIRAPPVLAG